MEKNTKIYIRYISWETVRSDSNESIKYFKSNQIIRIRTKFNKNHFSEKTYSISTLQIPI